MQRMPVDKAHCLWDGCRMDACWGLDCASTACLDSCVCYWRVHCAQGHSWNPYNVWMEAYSAAGHHSSSDGSSDSYHGADLTGGHDSHNYYAAQRMAAAATAAAGANSSGLSDFADPLAAHGTSNDEHASGLDANMQHSPAALRAALLQQHGLALEQFGSLQDALAALAERDERETVVGLAEGDYDSTWLP